LPLGRERGTAPQERVAATATAFYLRIAAVTRTLLALAFFLLGAVSLGLALYLGWPGALFYWFAASYLGLAYCYARGSCALLGKREDGGLHWASVLLFLPYLLLVWSFFHLKRMGLRREACWHRVAEGLYLGRRALPGELPPDTRSIVDLTCEFAEPRSIVDSVDYRCLPSLNRYVPDPDAFRALVEELAGYSHPVFIHCGAGRGRAAAFAAALLLARGLARDVDEAEKWLRSARPGVRLHPVQRELASTSWSPGRSSEKRPNLPANRRTPAGRG
jgi:protein-tyrosine phosphatase